MKCPKCKADVSEDSHFCSKCGTPVKDTADLSVSQTKTIQKPAISSGKVIAGKYMIMEEIGRGGMGVVYKAEDTRLKRAVALKFLPPELTQDEEAKKRFIQEAQATAALSHPNICTIYEIDEHQDQTFIAMEYIQGHSLRQRLEEGPLEIDEAKDLAIQVAEGIQEAHDKGIIHRDIKPANIMLTEKGQAKITDFGLAKLSWGVDLTKTSTFMGTVAYMSPEQARGERVDHRSDIWSFGCMLYEMLTGERPFTKSQEHALIYSIINEKPTPPTSIREDIPSHFEQIIEKALAKRLNARYQSLQELINALKQPPLTSFTKPEKSIIVLPFEDMSPKKDNEYFSDGLTEEIISDLSKVQSLLVISRSSAMTFKGTKKKLKNIASEVDVRYVLEGSVRKAGNNLRITAQLIDAADDTHLWSDKYTGTLDDVFEIQEKVSRSIVDELKLKLSPEEDVKLAGRATESVSVFEYYHRAKIELSRTSKEGLDNAVRILNKGLEMIGDHALFYSGLGLAYYSYYDLGFQTDADLLQKTKECAEKALDMSPETGYGYFLLGCLERAQGSLIQAYKYSKLASSYEQYDPGIIDFHVWYLVLHHGKPEFAKPMVEKLITIDPLSPINYMVAGMMHVMLGDYEQAFNFLHKPYEIEPKFMKWGWMWISYALAMNNQFDEAYSVIDQAVKEDPDHPASRVMLFYKYAFMGDSEKALKSLPEELKAWFWDDPDLVWPMAGCYSKMGALDLSLDLIERALDRGWTNYPVFSEIDPLFDNVRGESRFKKLMERVKYEWENFEV